MKKSSSLHKKNSQIYSHRRFYLLPRDEMREIHENSRIALQGLLSLIRTQAQEGKCVQFLSRNSSAPWIQ